jgi:hypothetical protein
LDVANICFHVAEGLTGRKCSSRSLKMLGTLDVSHTEYTRLWTLQLLYLTVK